MTKILSELLEAKEPDFRIGLQKLERACGNQNRDISLSSDVTTKVRTKLSALNLDPDDTTAPELFHALNQKLAETDQELAKVLGLDPLADNFLDDLAVQLRKLMGEKQGFVLRPSSAKKLLAGQPPKRAMKALGYRSLDSFLRHEPLTGIYAAAEIYESSVWRRNFTNSYKNLTPSEFETRPLTIVALNSQRWRDLDVGSDNSPSENIFFASEIGSLGLMPSKSYAPGVLTATFLLSVSAVNEVLAMASYLRLYQVRADFGKIVAEAAKESPTVTSPIWSHELDWRTIHKFITESDSSIESQLVDDDLTIASPADVLASLSPSLSFWAGTDHLAYGADNNQPVSLNPLDVALSYVNGLPFEARVKQNFKQNLWQKLWQSYLQAEILGEKLIAGIRLELQGPEMAAAPALEDPATLFD